MSTDSQRILITGAASGLGLALARRYAQDGGRVLLTDVDPDALARAVDGLGGGSNVRGIALDVRSTDQWEAARQWCVSEWGGLDVLVNNAGVAAGGRFAQTTIEDWEWILEINLKGVIQGCRTFVPLFQEQGHGQLVNVASMAGLINPPVMASYNVVKAGVVSLSETLRFELEPDGITTSVVCPSFFRTGLATSFRTPDAAVRGVMDKLVTRSTVPADQIAKIVQDGVAARRFLILTDREGRIAYFAKRFLPPVFEREVRKGARRILGKIAAQERAGGDDRSDVGATGDRAADEGRSGSKAAR